MRGLQWILVSVLMACAGGAQQPVDSKHYPPSSIEANVIRSWGDDAMGGLMRAWETAYRRQHPEIMFQDELLGSATGMAGIITNTSDLALMGRPATVNEIIGFEWVYRAKPLGVQVANGGVAGEGASPAPAVLVPEHNPLAQISLAQLAAVLGCPTDGRMASTWGMAGATGDWALKPLHAYVYDDQTGTGAYLQQALLGSGDCWNWDVVHEFKDMLRGGKLVPAGAQIAEALQHDPLGLALVSPEYAGRGIKTLAVSGTGAAVRASVETIVDGTYLLRRGVYIYLTRLPGQAIDPKVSAFLRFVLSEEGQALVRLQGSFLPLNAMAASEQRKKLE